MPKDELIRAWDNKLTAQINANRLAQIGGPMAAPAITHSGASTTGGGTYIGATYTNAASIK